MEDNGGMSGTNWARENAKTLIRRWREYENLPGMSEESAKIYKRCADELDEAIKEADERDESIPN